MPLAVRLYTVMELTLLFATNSSRLPGTVSRPILLPICSANHTFPSGPVVIPSSPAPLVGVVNELMIVPAGVMRRMVTP